MGFTINLGSGKKKPHNNNKHYRSFLSELILGILEKVLSYGLIIGIGLTLLYIFKPDVFYLFFGGLF